VQSSLREYHYVTDTLRVGATAAEANQYGLDLDNDANHTPDNTLGRVLGGFSSVFDFNAPIASSLEMGDVVLLHSLRTHSLMGGPAGWRVYLGAPEPDPVLTGGGSFTIDPLAPSSTTLPGLITARRFAGGPGTVPVRLSLVPGEPPIELHLAAARIQASCTAHACGNGKLGGGINTTEVDTLIIPALAAAFQSVLDADSCTISTTDSCTDKDRQLLSLFDANGDFEITADELRESFFIQAVLAPDLDLFQADGSPGSDGFRDSLSLGLGFTAKNAIFDVQ
jgi:hypothetical protein